MKSSMTAKWSARLRSSGLVLTMMAMTASSAAAGPGMPQTAGLPTQISIKTPSPVKVGENTFDVVVHTSRGIAINDATVTMVLEMPKSEGMANMPSTVVLGQAADGVYRGTATLAMAGKWKASITVEKQRQRIGRKRISLVVAAVR